MARDSTPDSRPEDCIEIDGEVYDVARWAARNHPGGEIVRLFLGRNGSAVFRAFHGPLARRALKGLRARRAPVPCPEANVDHDAERDFEALRARSDAEGLFVARHGWFAMRGAFLLALAACAVALLALVPSCWVFSALLLALAWQQCGWFAHDLLHHSVFTNRLWGNLAGIFFGGVVAGYSPDWWKRKHNAHHALPNVRGADTDIDTLPLLAFTERDLVGASPLARWMVRVQVFTVLPIVASARLNWMVQSAVWALRTPGVDRRALELAAIVVHHAWVFGAFALLPSWGLRIAGFMLAQFVSGLMTGTVFLVGHNARPIMERSEAPGFYALQCIGTQNVRAPWGTRWFFGGLERQIEHHLFPTMPRHHHVRVEAAVRALCARHNLAYTERGFFEGLGDVMCVLARVARAASVNEEVATIAAQPSPER